MDITIKDNAISKICYDLINKENTQELYDIVDLKAKSLIKRLDVHMNDKTPVPIELYGEFLFIERLIKLSPFKGTTNMNIMFSLFSKHIIDNEPDTNEILKKCLTSAEEFGNKLL